MFKYVVFVIVAINLIAAPVHHNDHPARHIQRRTTIHHTSNR